MADGSTRAAGWADHNGPMNGCQMLDEILTTLKAMGHESCCCRQVPDPIAASSLVMVGLRHEGTGLAFQNGERHAALGALSEVHAGRVAASCFRPCSLSADPKLCVML